MRTCFIPNCDNYNKAWRNRPFFVAPRKPELFAKWKAVLPKIREFKSTDKVCVKHFEDSDLMTKYEVVIDNKLVQIPRERIKLKTDAVPSKNLTECEYPKRGRKIGTKMEKNKANNIDVKSKKIILKRIKVKVVPKPENMIKIVNEIVQNEFDTCQAFESGPESKEEDQSGLTSPGDLTKNNNISNKPINEDCFNQEIAKETKRLQQIEPTEKEKEIFNNLYEDIFEVELPSTLWGIHRDPSYKFIAFTYFDPISRLTSKSIILNNNLNLELCVLEKKLESKRLEDNCSTEFMGEVLSNADKMRLCFSAGTTTGPCEIQLNESDDEFCKTCMGFEK